MVEQILAWAIICLTIVSMTGCVLAGYIKDKGTRY